MKSRYMKVESADDEMSENDDLKKEHGDLVYLHHDSNKSKSPDTSTDCDYDYDCDYVRKFAGNQLRNASYKVKRPECFKVPLTSIKNN